MSDDSFKVQGMISICQSLKYNLRKQEIEKTTRECTNISRSANCIEYP